MFDQTPYYSFNRFAPWELFCSAFKAYVDAQKSESELERIHSNRELLLFSFAYLEALLNYLVQKEAGKKDVDKIVRYGKLEDKISFIESKKSITLDRKEFNRINDEYLYLRHEIVHFKRKDQKAQQHTQFMDSRSFIRLLQLFSVRIYTATQDEFPYWLTGWNYTGFNGNICELCILNNGNGFGHSLARMGFKFRPLGGAGTMGFSPQHMASLDHFTEITKFLNAYPDRIEPIHPWIPLGPRIVQSWWDKAFLKEEQKKRRRGLRALRSRVATA